MSTSQKRNIRRFFLLLFFLTVIIPVIFLFSNLYRLAANVIGFDIPSLSPGLSPMLIIETLLSAAAVAVIITVSIYLNKTVIDPLFKIQDGVHAIKSGLMSFRLDLGKNNEISEIANTFNDMAASLEDSYKKLQQQKVELSDKNWELQEANFELEASYGQLQATIDQLNEAEQKYHSLVRNIPEVVCVTDNSGIITFVNHICTDILGFEKSEMTGMYFKDLISPGASCPHLETIAESLEKKSALTVELPLVRKDGITVLTEAKFTKYVFNGEVLGLQAIIRDITEKRKMEEEIMQSNREMAALNSVSKSLTSTLDFDNLTRMIVHEVVHTLNYPACVLRLLDNTGTHLFLKEYSGPFFKDITIPLGFLQYDFDSCTVGRCIRKNEPIVVTEIPDRWYFGRMNSSKPANERLKELLMLPVNVKNNQIGALIIGSYVQIKQNDISLLSSVANNAAIAIDNAILYETSKNYFIKTIDALIATVEAKDSYTEGHSRRVAAYAVKISERLGLSKEQIEDIRIAGILHDIGKIGISDSILLKPGKLSVEEYELVKQHPLISNKILYPVGFSERTLKAIAFHHERYDGKGYPYGLTGKDTTIESQIIAVTDAYDAMTSNRSYRSAMTREEAIMELISNKATQFNPEIVDIFIEIITE